MRFIRLAFVGFPLFGLIAFTCVSTAKGDDLHGWNNRVTTAKLPIAFEPNEGQAEPGTRFLARAGNMQLRLRPMGFDMAFRGNGIPHTALRVSFVGANSKAFISPSERMGSQSSYILGRYPSDWHAHIPNYGRITYSGIYPGISLVFYGNGRQLENDYVVAPGADYHKIRLRVSDADRISGEQNGSLKLSVSGGDFVLGRPDVYQDFGNGRHIRRGRWVLLAKDQVGFEIENYDPAIPLVIDPVLDYSTYLADTSVYMGAVAADSSGNIYVTGLTFSGAYPATPNSFQQNCRSCAADLPDIFVTKLNMDGSALIYSTYLGGSDYDQPFGIAVDANGNAVVVGRTASKDYPIKNQIPEGGASNAFYTDFITSLSPDGASLNYSSLIQGGVLRNSVALDPEGNAYTSGGTWSPNFPVTPGALNNATPAYPKTILYLSKFLPTGNLGYSALLGDASPQSAGRGPGLGVAGIAVDALGNAYIAGGGGTLWPTTAGAYQTEIPAGLGSYAEFVAKISADGSSFIYSTFIGDGVSTGIAVDGTGNAFVTGWGADASFPTTSNAYQKTIGSGPIVASFFSELSADGSQLVYSSFFPQNADITDLISIALDPSGNIWLAGSTRDAAMPLVHPMQTVGPNIAGAVWSGVLAEFDPAGAHLLFCTYYGDLLEGAPNDGTEAVVLAIDVGGKIHIAGVTGSQLYTSPNAYRGSVTPPPPHFYYMYGFVEAVDPSVQAASICIDYPVRTGIAFGGPGAYVPVGTMLTSFLTLQSCGALPLTISNIQSSDPTFGVPLALDGCLKTLQVGESCTLSIVFQPLSAGTYLSSVRVTSNASMPTFVPVGAIAQIMGTAPDFAFGAIPAAPALTIGAPGNDSAPVTLKIVAENGFAGTVSFSPASCSITPAESGASCTFSPNSITGSGTTQVTIHTTAPQSTKVYRVAYQDGRVALAKYGLPILAGCTCFLICITIFKRYQRTIPFGLMVCVLLVVCHACGGSGSSPGSNTSSASGTPINNVFTVTVTATSGQLSHSTTFAFTVK